MVCNAFRIQAIAQQSELHAALAERELAGQVISGERVGSDIGVEHARVQDAGDPDRFRRVDDIGVVDDALAASLLDTSRSRVTPASAARMVCGSE